MTVHEKQHAFTWCVSGRCSVSVRECMRVSLFGAIEKGESNSNGWNHPEGVNWAPSGFLLWHCQFKTLFSLSCFVHFNSAKSAPPPPSLSPSLCHSFDRQVSFLFLWAATCASCDLLCQCSTIVEPSVYPTQWRRHATCWSHLVTGLLAPIWNCPAPCPVFSGAAGTARWDSLSWASCTSMRASRASCRPFVGGWLCLEWLSEHVVPLQQAFSARPSFTQYSKGAKKL